MRGNGEGWVQGAGGLPTEADERDTDKESVRFFYIAKGPLAELRPQLQIAFEIGHIERDTFKSLDRECRQLGKTIGALIKAGNNMPAYSRLPLASRLF